VKKKLYGALLIMPIVAILITEVLMANSVQQKLTVVDRNSQLHASLMLVPLAEMFAFVEDIIQVRVQYALASGRNKEVGMLIRSGFKIGIILGVSAACIITVLVFIPDVFNFLVQPGTSTFYHVIDSLSVCCLQKFTYMSHQNQVLTPSGTLAAARRSSRRSNL
jgi:hypothetical protein